MNTAETARRDAILDAAYSHGIRQKELAAAIGMSAGKLCRWGKGAAKVSEAEMTAMEACIAGQDNANPHAPHVRAPPSADEVDSALVALDRLAGAPCEEDELRALAKRHRRAAVGSLLRLMTSAKSENVRLRATEVLLERIDGKAVQQIVDLTPHPPATDEELLTVLDKLTVRRELTEH